MTATHSDTVPTRLVDLTGLSLGDLSDRDLYAGEEISAVCAPLVSEVSSTATVSLAGSDS